MTTPASLTQTPTIKPPTKKPVLDMILAGIAASVAGFFTNPMETVKVKFQLQRELAQGNVVYTSIADCFKKTWKYQGIRGIQAGLSAGLLYQFVMNLLRIGSFEAVTNMDSVAAWGSGNEFLTTGKNFLLGAIFGGIGAATAAPLFLVKTRLQTANPMHHIHPEFTIGQQYGYKGTWDALNKVYTQGYQARGFVGGIRSLWRNAPVSGGRVFMGGGVQLASYNLFKNVLTEHTPLNQQSYPTAFYVTCSTIAALCVTTAMNPFDVVVSRLNNQDTLNPKYKNAPDCFKKIWVNEGIHGFYKGYFSHFARLCPHGVITFTTFEWLKTNVKGEMSLTDQMRLAKIQPVKA